MAVQDDAESARVLHLPVSGGVALLTAADTVALVPPRDGRLDWETVRVRAVPVATPAADPVADPVAGPVSNPRTPLVPLRPAQPATTLLDPTPVARSLSVVLPEPDASRLSARHWRWTRHAITGLVFTVLTISAIVIGLHGAAVSPVVQASPAPVPHAPDPHAPPTVLGVGRHGPGPTRGSRPTARPGAGRSGAP